MEPAAHAGQTRSVRVSPEPGCLPGAPPTKWVELFKLRRVCHGCPHLIVERSSSRKNTARAARTPAGLVPSCFIRGHGLAANRSRTSTPSEVNHVFPMCLCHDLLSEGVRPIFSNHGQALRIRTLHGELESLTRVGCFL